MNEAEKNWHRMYNMNLYTYSTSGKCCNARSRLEKLHFCSSPIHQTLQHFSTGLVPFREFLRGDGIWILARIQPRDQRPPSRSLHFHIPHWMPKIRVHHTGWRWEVRREPDRRNHKPQNTHTSGARLYERATRSTQNSVVDTINPDCDGGYANVLSL